MSDLHTRFTPLQTDKLQKVGLASLYNFITYLPSNIHQVWPMSQFSSGTEDGSRFLDQARLEKITQRQGKQKFLVLEWYSTITSRRYSAYFFSLAKFALQNLSVGREYQLLLTYRNNFWNLDKFALFSSVTASKQLQLGKAQIQPYLEVVYPKLGLLQSNYFKILHSRLLSGDYKLNLAGLVPPNNLISQVINLEPVHKPTNLSQYREALNKWISLQVYLKLALAKYVNHQTEQQIGRASSLDVDFLKEVTLALPFQLSNSQKQAVWEMLQEVCP